MLNSIGDLWHSYENWLKKSTKQCNYAFNEPASLEDFNQLKDVVGLELGEEFKRLYSIHNGEVNSYGLFFGFDFLNINKIISEIKSMVHDRRYRGISTPESAIKVEYYHKG